MTNRKGHIIMKVLITGTSCGIGRAAAIYFLGRGHEVYGVDVLPGTIGTSDIDECGRRSCRLSGAEAGCGVYRHFIADITDPAALEEALPEGFMPEILINNAGVQDSGRDIEVNLRGMINVTERYAIGNEQIRAVVNIGSASGHTGSEFPEYAASKGGVIAYTRNAALRLAPRATCNSIDPGGVTTELNRCVMDDAQMWDRIMELTPLKRWASPEEIAEWIYFVAVNNRFMTGQNLLIDGGEAGNMQFVWPEQ